MSSCVERKPCRAARASTRALGQFLTLLVDRCVELLDVGAAGLMLAGPDGGLRVMASTSEAMRMLELFELQAQEGPCLDAFRTGQPVVNHELAMATDRWPRFAPQALTDVGTIGILQHRAALEAQRLNDQLNNALKSRIVIEQAKVMVAERAELNMDQAFNLLRNHSRNHNLRLVGVARDVIGGTLTVSALDPPASVA